VGDERGDPWDLPGLPGGSGERAVPSAGVEFGAAWDQWPESSGPGGGNRLNSEPAAGRGGLVLTPVGWLVAAAGCAAVSVFIGSLGQGHRVLPLLGWLLGGAISIGLLTVYSVRDGQKRADSWYVARAWVGQARAVVLVLAAAGVGLNAWWFADSISRTFGS
jgi:hypothetical protein